MTLGGIVPALIGIYDDDGQPDANRTTAVVNHLLGRGVHGFYVGGSTGESLLQSAAEREKVLATVVEAVAGRATVIAHVGAPDTATTIRLAHHATDIGADAISAVTPIYYELSAAAHADHFKRVAEHSELPLIGYHFPGRTGVVLPPEWFIELAEDGVLAGLKYTSTDLHALAEIRRGAPADFIIFNGSDEVFAGGLALGADGAIGSTFNAIPGVYLDLLSAWREGDVAAALTRQAEANTFIHEMAKVNFIAFLRRALLGLGLDTGQSRAPLPRLSAQEIAAVDASLAQLGLPTP